MWSQLSYQLQFSQVYRVSKANEGSRTALSVRYAVQCDTATHKSTVGLWSTTDGID